MKKEYKTPTMKVVKVQQTQMLCMSEGGDTFSVNRNQGAYEGEEAW